MSGKSFRRKVVSFEVIRGCARDSYECKLECGHYERSGVSVIYKNPPKTMLCSQCQKGKR